MTNPSPAQSTPASEPKNEVVATTQVKKTGIAWAKFFTYAASSGATISALFAIAIAVGLGLRQLNDKPIAIDTFTVVRDADKFGIAPSALADQLKAQISRINTESGDLFEVRKLVDNAIPLDVKLGNTGWTFATLARAFGWQFTSAEVSGRISQIGNSLILQFTTTLGDRIQEDRFSISLPAAVDSTRKAAGAGPPTDDPGDKFTEDVREAVDCLALKIVKSVSQDVAANFLHAQLESGDENAKAKASTEKCIGGDDVDLYSQVVIDPTASVSARVNALVGLSVHYSQMNQRYEELSMALAATTLASKSMRCEDRSLLGRWDKLTCWLHTNDRNNRAQIAAWMQRGAAYSDYASIAPTVADARSRRTSAIAAYEHVLEINRHYALAWDSIGVQHSALNDTVKATAAYQQSLAVSESAPAQIDFGLELIHGRDDVFGKLRASRDALTVAEDHFQQAIYLRPNYWDAHGRLGYVLYAENKFPEAADALDVALVHDQYNRHLRRLLASVLARTCRFDDARKRFMEAESAAETAARSDTSGSTVKSRLPPEATGDALDIQSDWGRVLEEFRLTQAALEQENAVLEVNPKHVDALVYRGLMRIKNADKGGKNAEAGLADLQAAWRNDSKKSAFVLEAYLVSLVQIGDAVKAVSLYREWAQEGYVPRPATETTNVSSLPPNQGLRVIYAVALENAQQNNRKELEILSAMGIDFDPGANSLRLRNGAAVGDEGDQGLALDCSAQLPPQTPLKEVSITVARSAH
jgi:tetratricopeptide (TPR) repeat protein